ncbi:hypothetical protein Bca52824_037741 [Brassica carinata]|uniref:C2H2-type domain-containing protein n=1 Tax=Brassica carinata TaxID=52824 RepID=A0A8X7RN97_BRACI|nr:hypothetical protein Bca52824_037741 [Brassica carinata]
MEAFEELIATSKEQSLILKGKRTKRQRTQSLFCPARDAIEEYTYLDSKENALGNNVENHKKDGVITSSSPSASWSSNNNPTTLKAEEDEEDLDIAKTSSSNGGGKTDSYVYQCKTCDWTFSSFQALGGHRASHKKHKATSNYSNLGHVFVYDDMYLQIVPKNRVFCIITCMCPAFFLYDHNKESI